jgi:DNA adenine methylase
VRLEGDVSVTGPLKWHGGKQYLARRIVDLMPPHTHYVEPYAGGLAVLLEKEPEGISEVVNDINRDLTNFWRVLQGVETFEQFRRFVEAVPFSEEEWRKAADIMEHIHEGDILVDDRSVPWAAWFFIHCRQSLAGRMTSFAPLSRTRTRRGMNEQASAWLNAVEGLPAVHARLKRVVVLNHDALDVIRQQDGEQTLFYCDPPYLHETRSAPDVYAHEMSYAEHDSLLNVLRGCKGKVMLSGYPSALYEQALHPPRWRRLDFDISNHASGGKEKRRMTECLWVNFL